MFIKLTTATWYSLNYMCNSNQSGDKTRYHDLSMIYNHEFVRDDSDIIICHICANYYTVIFPKVCVFFFL